MGQDENGLVQQVSRTVVRELTVGENRDLYVYTAAIESSPDMNDCWGRYCRWMPAVWQGKVRNLLPELEGLIAATENPERQTTLQDYWPRRSRT